MRTHSVASRGIFWMLSILLILAPLALPVPRLSLNPHPVCVSSLSISRKGQVLDEIRIVGFGIAHCRQQENL